MGVENYAGSSCLGINMSLPFPADITVKCFQVNA